MRLQQPVRDRNLSLWQSAVRETLANRGDVADDKKKQIEYGVSLHAKSEFEGKAPPATLSGEAAGALKDSKSVFSALKAHQSSDADQHKSIISELVTKYSSWDLAGWVQCGWYYVKYYVLAHLPPTYHDWQAHAPADPKFGVIDYKLPSNSRVLMIGDWGTHMDDNAALLRQALRKFEPDVIIHLGDVYYSGTVEECKRNVLDVIDKAVADLKLDRRPAFFAIPGNHDYYSGGSGFYQTISKVNSGVAGATQQASYFCLRTMDDKWQFLAMDTGYGDRNPIEQTAPGLQVHETEWHYDKLETFSGSTILLSHHQLYSAKEKLNGGTRPYLNEALYATFKKHFDRVAAWYWGHEHNFIVFEDNLKMANGDPALRKGRLLGCSAYEETQAEDPYKINYNQIRFFAGTTWRLKVSPFADPQTFYNHAFAIFDIAPEQVTVNYYEYPSWGQSNGPSKDPDIGNPLFTEDLAPTR